MQARSRATQFPLRALALFAIVIVLAPAAAAQTAYFPARGDAWERRTAEQVGLVAAQVQAAVDFAIASASSAPRNLLEQHLRSFGREPHGEATGPFRERGEPTGIIVRGGYIVAEWGDPHRVDPTFSVTKSFLSTTVGLAWDRGLVGDLHSPVRPSFAPVVALVGAPGGRVAPGVAIPASGQGLPTADGDAPPVPAGVAYDAFEVLLPFESGHNRKITWDHLLRQTSEWQGTLWGKPDWADRPRGDVAAWRVRERPEPGTVYTYNDVRVNLLALAALNVWRRPLPQVLKEHLMDPIGASHTWRWFGYDNSWVVLDGQLVQSVSGGAHWGGGMWISARDMARFGYLTMHRGRWGDRQIISEEWIGFATTPGVQRTYGFMNFFLNTDRRPLPAAPADAFYHVGAGNNLIYVDRANDLVIVTRWIASTNALNGVIERVLTGARPPAR
ncbi:MAG TPA: serine hydrolase [Gemmatimonadaceae bacterium]|nr:serine hydrolase [Gemmatimonadaceae bacterium]